MAKKLLARSVWEDSSQAMIRGGFLTSEERQDLTELARDGTVEHESNRNRGRSDSLDGEGRSFVGSITHEPRIKSAYWRLRHLSISHSF